MVSIKFQEATVHTNDAGEREYTFKRNLWIFPGYIIGYYDHVLLLPGNKVPVMETAEQIGRKLP